MYYNQRIELPSNILVEESHFQEVFTNLAKNYFPDGDANIFPGRLLSLVNPQLREIVCKYGSDIYDKMILTDPIVEQLTGFLFKSISTFATVPVDSGSDWRHRFCTAFIKANLDNVEELADNETKMNWDLVRYGTAYASLSYERCKFMGLLPTMLSAVDDICIKDILEVRNNRGIVVGYVPTGGIFTRHFSEGSIDFGLLSDTVERHTVTTDELASMLGQLDLDNVQHKKILETINFVPVSKVFNFRYLPTSDSFAGSKGTLDSVIHFWWMRQQILATILFYTQNYSLPVRVGTLAEGAKQVAVKDNMGRDLEENGVRVNIDARVDYKQSIAASKNSGIIVVPNGYLLSLLQADPSILGKLWDLYMGLGTEMKNAVILQTASVSENSSGTSSESQQPILYLNVHYLKQRKKIAFKKLYRTILNFSFPEWKMYCPNPHTGTLNGMPYDLTEIGVLNQAEFFDQDQKTELAREMNLPV